MVIRTYLIVRTFYLKLAWLLGYLPFSFVLIFHPVILPNFLGNSFYVFVGIKGIRFHSVEIVTVFGLNYYFRFNSIFLWWFWKDRFIQIWSIFNFDHNSISYFVTTILSISINQMHLYVMGLGEYQRVLKNMTNCICML